MPFTPEWWPFTATTRSPARRPVAAAGDLVSTLCTTGTATGSPYSATAERIAKQAITLANGPAVITISRREREQRQYAPGSRFWSSRSRLRRARRSCACVSAGATASISAPSRSAAARASS